MHPIPVRWLIGAVMLGLMKPLMFAFMWFPGVNVAAFLLFQLSPLIYAAIYLIAALRRRAPMLRAGLWALLLGLVVWLSGLGVFWLLEMVE
ncbi:hypothetical protein Q0812_09420 [Brevundimonas sp. 2R-24]|uniref:Uncharacterized protein n=1 Tax=Peiella sedimenti TaxID=3061083 RepID=A0ABT8SM59_9CAUL|nr:hypothetical protein [Caulobacteraceae bacterium XZ-24]